MEERSDVVIGGTSGIGRAIVDGLARLGHRVYTGSRSATDVPFEAHVTPFTWDVTDRTAPASFAGILPDAIQGLVYCPGTIRLAPFARLSERDFLEDFEINLLGAVRAIEACLPALKKSPKGASIVLFSTVAVQTGMPFHASIASAKGAVEGLTRALAAELAPRVRVNAIAPSLTETPLAGSLLSTEAKRLASEARHPLKRIGTPEEIAAMALFLLDDSSSWMSGQILAVDGGMSSLRTFTCPGRF